MQTDVAADGPASEKGLVFTLKRLLPGKNENESDNQGLATGKVPEKIVIQEETSPCQAGPSRYKVKVNEHGRPLVKEILAIFSTLITAMKLTMHKQYFRSFPHSFTADEAYNHLSHLELHQSNRSADSMDSNRIITTNIIKTYTISRKMANALCQHFMDARLIENAIDPSSRLFKIRSVYKLTPKGLHVVERFVSKNGVIADDLVGLFKSQPICLKLLDLERTRPDDGIVMSRQVITTLFRWFVGRKPNYIKEPDKCDSMDQYNQTSLGIPLTNVVERVHDQGPLQEFRCCFFAIDALDWLCDFTSLMDRAEAAAIMAHFVRLGFVTLLSDKCKGSDPAIIVTVIGTTTGPNDGANALGKFSYTAKAIYHITDEGIKAAKWTEYESSTGRDPDRILHGSGDSTPGTPDPFSCAHEPTTPEHGNGPQIDRQMTGDEKPKQGDGSSQTSTTHGESNSDRLRLILGEPLLRSLFSEFQHSHFCEDNLMFWSEVQELRHRFLVNSTVTSSGEPQHIAIEKHHDNLTQRACVIYNKYFAPDAEYEMSIDYTLRMKVSTYLNEVMIQNTGKALERFIDPKDAQSLNTAQLHHIIRLYEKMQLFMFRLMAIDTVPKFSRTKRFIELRKWIDEVYQDYEFTELDQEDYALDAVSDSVLGDDQIHVTVSRIAG